MLGNLGEWVEDCYEDNYTGASTDGSARATGDCEARVSRGGNFVGYPSILRDASRYHGLPDSRSSGVGFRLARTL